MTYVFATFLISICSTILSQLPAEKKNSFSAEHTPKLRYQWICFPKLLCISLWDVALFLLDRILVWENPFSLYQYHAESSRERPALADLFKTQPLLRCLNMEYASMVESCEQWVRLSTAREQETNERPDLKNCNEKRSHSTVIPGVSTLEFCYWDRKQGSLQLYSNIMFIFYSLA